MFLGNALCRTIALSLIFMEWLSGFKMFGGIPFVISFIWMFTAILGYEAHSNGEKGFKYWWIDMFIFIGSPIISIIILIYS